MKLGQMRDYNIYENYGMEDWKAIKKTQIKKTYSVDQNSLKVI